MILFFDTETTGLVDPRLVQLGMILTDDKLEIVSECCLLVKPAKKIEEGAIKAHGITNEYANEFGLRLEEVNNLFCQFRRNASLLVAHNIKYDKQVMFNEVGPCEAKEEFCTMQACTPILKLPNKWKNGYKWPKLEEACAYFEIPLNGAHNALVDCRATMEIYKRLQPNPNWTSPKEAIMDNGTVRVD